MCIRDRHVVVGPAPSIRVTLGECFGMPIGTNVEGKMVTALRRLGFDKVFDVDNAADFTIMEEGTEFLHRLQNGGTLPLITSCSPGWIRFCEQHLSLIHISWATWRARWPCWSRARPRWTPSTPTPPPGCQR